jgi:hypothetical protein
MFKPCKLIFRQTGGVLILMTFIIALVIIAYFLQALDPARLKLEQDKKTYQSLANAKEALLAYASEPITGAINGALLTCNYNCPRPGDLPCPDIDNDGAADPPCSVNSIGRLPWKTMGVGDIRDGAGERLWYAVSNQYRNNPRIIPLNSESFGTISYRNNTGALVYDATGNTGIAAVVIAPNAPLTRLDNVVQSRASGFENIANNYLDIANGEDNADYFDGTTNGFISGKVSIGEHEILNDIVLPVTRNEMNAVMEPRVLAEVMQAILYNFCPGRANVKNRTCTGSTINDYLPDPASVSDLTCLGNSDIPNTSCSSNAGLTLGRIAVGGNTSPITNAGWESQDSNSILQGKSQNNWFQQNQWRELIFYAVAPACTEPFKNCTGSGFLTLNNALTPVANKQVVLIASGATLSFQTRGTLASKMSMNNYLEDENILPLDNTYSRLKPNNNRNDKVITIP